MQALAGRFRKSAAIASIALTVMLSGVHPATAADLELTDVPLFLNVALDPNVMVTLDDSGSMEWAFMPDSIFGQRTSNRAKSAAYNAVFYNPNVSYDPPLNADGTPFSNSNFFNASEDGFVTGAATRDLSTNYQSDWYYDGTGQEFADAAQAAYYYVYNGGGLNNDANYTYVQVTATSGPGSSDERTNFANWYTYYRKRGLLAKTSATRAFGRLGADLRVAWQNLNSNTTIPNVGKFTGTKRADFFSWLHGSPRSGGTPLRNAVARIDAQYRRTDSGNPYELDPGVDNREYSCRQNYHVSLTDGYWNGGSPGVGDVDNQSHTLPTSADPDVTSRNYSPTGVHSQVYAGDEDNYVADQAFKMWAEDLRTDLTNNVRAFLNDTTTGVTGTAVTFTEADNPWTNDEVYWNPANDPATWQHVVNFNIGLGVNGNRTFPTDLVGLRQDTVEWGTNQIDDLWHAAVNSRGKYFSANNPDDLVDAFVGLLTDILTRKGSASVTSVSSGVVTTGSRAFRTGFDSSDWSGNVIALPVNTDGTLGSPLWDARCQLDGGPCSATGANAGTGQDWDERDILSIDDSGDGIGFYYGSMSSNQQDILDLGTGDSDVGTEIVKFLRGDRTNEVANGGTRRTRGSRLGDVVHSSSIYVGGPSAGYRDFPSGSPERTAADADSSKSYQTFRSTHQNRRPLVFVGANDGMLHAFDAATGNEAYAYVPSTVYPKLPDLADTAYGHRAFVDNTPVARDVFIGGEWRSVLVGTLRFGGQGVFALDITNADCGSTGCFEASSASRVLWEFNDDSSDGEDMGYTYGEPTIVRAHNDKWVVLVPNGYNSQVADDNVGSGTAVLYILDMQTGALVRKIDTGVGSSGTPNGLSSVTAGDFDNNFVADVAFAGDLYGNMYRFDLDDPDPNNWGVEVLFQPDTFGDQAITTPPRLGRDSATGNVAVYFGTGKYIELSDRGSAGLPEQRFYGIQDLGANSADYPITRSDLVRQDISQSGTERRVTDNPIPADKFGWEVGLPTQGERQITRALLRPSADRIIFATFKPNGEDPCLPGGIGWLMTLNTRNGGTPEGIAAFDFNGDGAINSSDDSTQVGYFLPSTAWGLTPVMPPGGGQGYIIPGGDGTVDVIKIPEFEWRRRAWRQMFIEE